MKSFAAACALFVASSVASVACQPGYPDYQPGFPGPRPGFPIPQPGFPIPQPGFPIPQPGFPIGQPEYPGPNEGFGGFGRGRPGGLTIAEAHAKCGNKAVLSCCNKFSQYGPNTNLNQGVFSSLLADVPGASGTNGLGLFDQCSIMGGLGGLTSTIPGMLPGDLAQSHCQQNIACCQDNRDTQSGGLIQVALPCIAINNLA